MGWVEREGRRVGWGGGTVVVDSEVGHLGSQESQEKQKSGNLVTRTHPPPSPLLSSTPPHPPTPTMQKIIIRNVRVNQAIIPADGRGGEVRFIPDHVTTQEDRKLAAPPHPTPIPPRPSE